MKKFFIIASAVLTFMGMVTAMLLLYISPVLYGDITAIFSIDVANFVSAHDGNLPKNWKEFCAWRSSRWKEEDLNKRFLILLPKQLHGGAVPVYIEIRDQQIKTMESFLNESIHYAKKSKS